MPSRVRYVGSTLFVDSDFSCRPKRLPTVMIKTIGCMNLAMIKIAAAVNAPPSSDDDDQEFMNNTLRYLLSQ